MCICDHVVRLQIKVWLAAWDVGVAQSQQLLRVLHEAFLESKQRCVHHMILSEGCGGLITEKHTLCIKCVTMFIVRILQWEGDEGHVGAAGYVHRGERLTRQGWRSQVRYEVPEFNWLMSKCLVVTVGACVCRCIVTCLADPNIFIMDHLLMLKPVRFLEGELIHDVSWCVKLIIHFI